MVKDVLMEDSQHVVTVTIRGKKMIAKASVKYGVTTPKRLQEIAILQLINKDLVRHTDIRIAQILGSIRHPETRHDVGIFTEYINGWNLTQLNISTFPHAIRSKWMVQIRETIERLYNIGLF